MKTVMTLAAFAALTGTALAQLNPLPPSSVTDGVIVQPVGLNAGATHWDSTSSLGAYKPASSTDGTAPITMATYNPLGLAFNATLPSFVQTNLNSLNTNGGVVRAIFLAESAGWLNSFGFTRSGNPAGPQSYTAMGLIESNPGSPPVNTNFGNYFDVSLAAGGAANFDFWFQGAGVFGPGDPNPPSEFGGVYTLFHPANSSPYTAPGNALWAQQSIDASTWIPSLGAYMNVATYLVALEDWKVSNGTDSDYTDLILGFQFFSLSGTPLTPVPEPSTYTLIGAAMLLGLVALRRLRSRKIQPPAGPAHAT